MKKNFPNGTKRFVFYLTEIICFPGFARIYFKTETLFIVAFMAIGMAIFLFVATYYLEQRLWLRDSNNQNSPTDKELFVTRGNVKYRIMLENVRYNLSPVGLPNGGHVGFTYVLGYHANKVDGPNDYHGNNESDGYQTGKKHLRELFFNFDKDGYICFVTEETASRYGRTFPDFFGKKLDDFTDIFGINNRDLLLGLSEHNNIQSTKEYALNTESIWVHWNFEALTDNNDEIEMIVASGHEITDVIRSRNQDHQVDYQTGLLNQTGLYRLLEEKTDVTSMATVFIDLWNFSRIYDYYGYVVGDRIILMVVEELKTVIVEKSTIARISNDRFAILFEDLDRKTLSETLHNIGKYSSSTFNIDGNMIQVDKRIGYAIYPDDTDRLDQLISKASLAMQYSSQENQFSVVRYTPDMGDRLRQNIVIAAKLRNALSEKIVDIHYQKAIDLHTGCTVYLEELVRWSDRELGFISPLKLFEVARENNLLEILEKYLVELALGSFRQIKKDDENCTSKLAINLAPRSFMDIDFIDFIDSKRIEMALDSSDICIEISESTFVNRLDECINRITAYKSRGYLIALDDFGKDYSSLAILEKVPFDIIKIDKLFIDKIDDEKNREIVKMLLKIGSIGNKEIIAEGVETAMQSEMLLNLGCHIQQGFYLHKPEKML